jgi:hypothetical protein
MFMVQPSHWWAALAPSYHLAEAELVDLPLPGDAVDDVGDGRVGHAQSLGEGVRPDCRRTQSSSTGFNSASLPWPGAAVTYIERSGSAARHLAAR